MTALSVPLDRLQRWMQAVVVQPVPPAEAVSCADAAALVPPERVDEVIRPTHRLTAVERVGIYHGMYLLRMEEALATDYAGLKHVLGDRGFFSLVRDYVQAHPSRNYSLNRLGDHLPEFVKNASGLRRRAALSDLARLELAICQVFEGAASVTLTAEAISAVPEEAWPLARLRTVSAFQLLSFDYPVNDYLQSVRDENHAHPVLRRQSSFVAVYRREYAVYRLTLTRAAHSLLASLAEGRTLGDALSSALAVRGRRPHADDLFRWFRQWVAGGVFQGVELPPSPENR